MTMPPTDHVLMVLGVQASAQRQLAGLVGDKAPEAQALKQLHADTAHLYDLLSRGVADGLLTELEARYGG